MLGSGDRRVLDRLHPCRSHAVNNEARRKPIFHRHRVSCLCLCQVLGIAARTYRGWAGPVGVGDNGPEGVLSTIPFLSRGDDRLGQVRESGNRYYRSMQGPYGCTQRSISLEDNWYPRPIGNTAIRSRANRVARACSMNPCGRIHRGRYDLYECRARQ